MSINWDGIKYFFQIPLEWFRKINNRVFNAYGANFITVNEGTYGGMEIGVDADAFVEQMGDVVKSVDGHSPDSDGAVSFNLNADKYVKTDANGNLATTNDQPITIDTSQYTPVNVNKKIVTDVTWTGTKLQYKYQNWTFVNGVLVDRSASQTQDIDTPTVITWQ